VLFESVDGAFFKDDKRKSVAAVVENVRARQLARRASEAIRSESPTISAMVGGAPGSPISTGSTLRGSGPLSAGGP
jgi:hypothetical protein